MWRTTRDKAQTVPTKRSFSFASVPSRFLPLLLTATLVAALAACTSLPPGRSAVDSVRIVHAKDVRGGDIEEKIATDSSTKFLFLFQGVAYDYSVYDESRLQRDMARVERFYRSKGFLDARARVARVLQVKPRHVRVEIVVDEGAPTLNRNVTVVGIDVLPPDVARTVRAEATDALSRGARFDEQKFKDADGAVEKALTDRGYAYAKVESDAELDLGAHVVDYGFRVNPGPKATFGPITFQGLEHTSNAHDIPEAPLRRAIDIQSGSPYSTAEIDSAIQALLDLQVFSSVQILPDLSKGSGAAQVVPITVKVEPTRLREITLGAGIELDEIKTDIHLVSGWQDHNFLGGLRHFSATVKPGVVLYPYRIDNWTGTLRPLLEEWSKVELRQPGFIEARTDAFVRPEFNVFPMLVELNPSPDSPVVGYREVKLPIGVDRTFWSKLYLALGYNFQLENPFAYVDPIDPALQTIYLSFPELVAHLDFRDNKTKPTKGVYVGGTLQAAGGIFGGSASDVRVQPEVRGYVPVARGITLASRASVGFLWSSNYGNQWNTELERSSSTTANTSAAGVAARSALERDVEIMYFRGFFSGGPTTNRGYPLLGVSPHGVVPFLNPATAARQVFASCDPTQAGTPAFNPEKCYLPVGGFTLWELQSELRVDVAGPLSGTVFCDMGDVSPNEGDIRLGHLHLSCGLGAAYDTPVGPVRVDIGYRIQPLQVLGFKDEGQAFNSDVVNGEQPSILGVPLAIAIGIGQAF